MTVTAQSHFYSCGILWAVTVTFAKCYLGTTLIILAKLYPDGSSIRRIIDDSRVDLSRIRLDSTPINNWHSVLIEAEKINCVDTLLDIVNAEYGTNKEFQKALVNYRQAAGSQADDDRHNDQNPDVVKPGSLSSTARNYHLNYLGAIMVVLTLVITWAVLFSNRPKPPTTPTRNLVLTFTSTSISNAGTIVSTNTPVSSTLSVALASTPISSPPTPEPPTATSTSLPTSIPTDIPPSLTPTPPPTDKPISPICDTALIPSPTHKISTAGTALNVFSSPEIASEVAKNYNDSTIAQHLLLQVGANNDVYVVSTQDPSESSGWEANFLLWTLTGILDKNSNTFLNYGTDNKPRSYLPNTPTIPSEYTVQLHGKASGYPIKIYDCAYINEIGQEFTLIQTTGYMTKTFLEGYATVTPLLR